MSGLLTLLPLAVSLVLIALLAKLAARLYRRSRLAWKHAFAFSALAMLVGVLGGFLNFVTGLSLGPLMGGVLGVVAQLALGGWFLGPRVLDSTGEAVQFKGGAIVAAIAFGIVVAVGVAAAVLVPLLSRGGQP